MSKKPIVVLAIAIVLLSGSLFSAKADCGCLPNTSTTCLGECQTPARDYDKANARCQGADQWGPTVPMINGVPVF